MEHEFNLSDKIMLWNNGTAEVNKDGDYFEILDVKEFIRLLEEFIENDDLLFRSDRAGGFISCNRDLIDFIDKLAGDKLI